MWGGRSKGRHENSGTSVGVKWPGHWVRGLSFETALEVCDGSGREVAAKGQTAGLVQHVEAFEKRDGETGSTARALEAGPASHPTIMGGFRAFKRRHGKDQSLRES